MSKTIKNILMVMGGNIFTLLAGIAAGFLLPKFLSVDGYGHYKTFTLYTSYIGLFSLGIIDGIVLRYGNFDYAELDEKQFRGYFRWYLYLHMTVSFIAMGAALLFLSGDIQIIIAFVAIELIPSNCIGYFQQISQITRRFRELSLRKVLQAIANLIVFIAFYFFFYKNQKDIDYKWYITYIVIILYLMFIWYALTYRRIVFGKHIGIIEATPSILSLIKLGIPLTIANLTSTFILTIDRQFVNVLFDNKSYAIYAFAYNMLSLVTVTISAVSTVMYPTLKRLDDTKLRNEFNSINSLMIIISFAAITLFFPLCAFVKWFLPQYENSLRIFRIIFPGVAITTPITTIMHNYYKVFGANARYFRKGLLTLFVSIVANFLAYLLFGTMESISIASIVILLFWYVLIDHFFVDQIKDYRRLNNYLYILIVTVSFYLTTSFDSWLIGLLLYICFFCLFTITIHRNTLISIKKGSSRII